MIDCCKEKRSKRCERKSDGKKFDLPRRFSKETCLNKEIKGYSMKSSCAPYKDCKKEFLYNKSNPERSRDIYSNDNPSDTINVKFKSKEDLKNTIKKLERIYKKGEKDHRRISQVALVIRVRLEVIKKNSKKNVEGDLDDRLKLIKEYVKFLKERTKIKKFEDRKKLKFDKY